GALDFPGDVALDDAHPCPELRGALAGERRELRLHQTDRGRVARPRQYPRQKSAAEESGVTGEVDGAQPAKRTLGRLPMTAIPLPQPRRTYGWRSWRDPLIELVLAIAVGWAVTLIEGAGKNRFPSSHVFVRNAILAISILILARGLETMLSWAIEQSRVPLIFRTLIYGLGAWTGFFLGLPAVAMIYGAEESDFRFHSFNSIYAASEAALIACIVGFVLHHNQKRKDRLQRAYERLKEHEFAEKELEIARAVQRRLLPPPEIDANGFHVRGRTDAAHIIGGDFYDVLRLDDGSLAVLVADVSGKGMAASLIMASCKAAVSLLATSARDATAVMGALNAKLCDDLQKREFVAMVYAHCRRSRVTIVNAGMP